MDLKSYGQYFQKSSYSISNPSNRETSDSYLWSFYWTVLNIVKLNTKSQHRGSSSDARQYLKYNIFGKIALFRWTYVVYQKIFRHVKISWLFDIISRNLIRLTKLLNGNFVIQIYLNRSPNNRFWTYIFVNRNNWIFLFEYINDLRYASKRHKTSSCSNWVQRNEIFDYRQTLG